MNKNEFRKLAEKIKKQLYKLLHGQHRLLEEEVQIILKTRADRRYKYMNNWAIQQLIKAKIRKMYHIHKEQLKCPHRYWDCDVQIRTIECCQCGKRSTLNDYRDLYKRSAS